MPNETAFALHAIIYSISKILKIIRQVLFFECAKFQDEADKIDYVDLHRLIFSADNNLKRVYKLRNDLVGNLIGLFLELVGGDLFEEKFHEFTS